MEVSVQLRAPAPLPPGKEPLVPTEQEARWAQSRYGAVVKRHVSYLYILFSQTRGYFSNQIQ